MVNGDLMSFVIWRAGDEGNTCRLEGLQGWDDDWKLQEGVSVAAEYPDGTYYRMDPDHPKRVRLSDCLANQNALPVISNRLKSFIEDKGLPDVEFLPVTIINHKGRIPSRDYWIVNPTRTVDCLDVEASQVTYSPFDGTIDLMKRMVLNEDRIADDVTIFRVLNVPGPVLLLTELADEIQAAGFTALLWKDPSKHKG